MIEKEEGQEPRFRYDKQYQDLGKQMGINFCINVEQALLLSSELAIFLDDDDVAEVAIKLQN